MAQPVISYPGAKWRFWKYIKQYIPRDITDYREAFFGGGSVGLSIADDPDFNLKRIIVGDLAPEIWAFWVGCRDYAPEVVEIAKDMFTKNCPTHAILGKIDPADDGYLRIYEEAIEEGKAFWKWSQEVDCSALSIPERAARTFLVNKISFSGMGDSGSLSKDQFISFSLSKTDRILAAQPLLQRMEIKNCSFEETMSDVDPEKSFIFLDPPYFRQESSGLYGKGGNTHKGFPHEHFAEFTKNTNCRWFITYDDSVKAAVNTETPATQLPLRWCAETDTVGLYAKEPLVVLAETGSSTLETRIETTVDSLSAPVQAGTVLGRLTVQVNGETVGSTELVVLQDYERSFWLYAKDLVRPWLPLLAAVGIALLIGLVLLARLLAHKAAVRRRRKALRVTPPRSRENP